MIFLINSDKLSYFTNVLDMTNIIRQSACLVVNPIKVDNFAALFNWTLVVRTSDSMMTPT